MYCIAVLAVNEKEGQDYAKYIIDYCTERSIFPLVELYQNQESFFEQIQKTVDNGAVIYISDEEAVE